MGTRTKVMKTTKKIIKIIYKMINRGKIQASNTPGDSNCFEQRAFSMTTDLPSLAVASDWDKPCSSCLLKSKVVL